MVSKPVKIKDYTNPVENPRKQLMQETDDKIQGRKGFIFKGFVTEKERIKQYLEERKKYLALEEESPEVERKRSKVSEPQYTYVQPKMRFKPRTDLERIYEAINEYSYGRVSKDTINRQLKSLDLNYMKKVKNGSGATTIENSSMEENIPRERKKQHLSEMNLKEILEEKERQEKLAKMEEEMMNAKDSNEGKGKLLKDKFKSKRRIVDNSGAKNLMKEYHIKTHFKAASVVASRTINTANPAQKNLLSGSSMLTPEKNSLLGLSNQNSNLSKTIQNSRAQSHGFKKKFIKSGENFANDSNTYFNKTHEPNIASVNSTGYNFFPGHSTQTSNFHSHNNSSNFNSTTQNFNIYQKFSKKFSLEEENLDIIESNPLLYNLNMNPLKKGREYQDSNAEKLEYLKKLAYNVKEEKPLKFDKKQVNFFKNLKGAKRRTNALLGDSPVRFFKNFGSLENDETEIKRDDDKIWVDNEAIPKSQVDLIAKRILSNCNYNHLKKNKEMLKKGTGKLMITSGMTIEEFTKRFNVPK